MSTPSNLTAPADQSADARTTPTSGAIRKALLVCGVLAALLYVGSDILAAMRYPGYSYLDHSVSELRAIGAPTRPLLVPILNLYALLELLFAVGVWLSAGPKRSLRVAGALLIVLGVLDLSAYFFPMHGREEISQAGARSLTDTAHIIGTSATVLLILLIISFGAAADGKWFRFYSYATIVVLIVAGVWTSMDAPLLEANLPTPWMGVKERINIYGYMLWLAMLALVLWRAPVYAAQDQRGGIAPGTQVPPPGQTPTKLHPRG